MLPDDLQRVAAWHLKCANVNLAKAAQADHQDEPKLVETYAGRAEGHRSYAEICEKAAEKLAKKARRAGFEPPTFAEVLAFTREKAMAWPKDEVRAWYDHFESNGWLVSGKSKMVDWHAAAWNGFRYWKRQNPEKAKAATAKDADPEGWRKFLDEHPRHEKGPFRYAKGYVQVEFFKWAKSL